MPIDPDRIAPLLERVRPGQILMELWNKDLTAQLGSRAKAIEDTFRARYEELRDQLGREAAALKTGKADRRDLSSLFANLAQHLNGDRGDEAEEKPAGPAAATTPPKEAGQKQGKK